MATVVPAAPAPPSSSGPGSIVDYDSLLTFAATMGHRTDLSSLMPTFVQLCETELSDRLILKDMESDEALTLTTGRNYVALPTGFISPIKFWLLVENVRVELRIILAKDLAYWDTNGQPRYVAIDAANLRFDSPADEDYTAYLRCVKTSVLGPDNTTNALLLARPHIYLYGTLKQVALYDKNDVDLQKYSGLFEAAIQRAKAADSRNRGIVTMTTDVPMRRGRSNILIDEP